MKSRAEYQREWRKANKAKSSAYSKKWRDDNKEMRAEIVASWRARNPGKVAAMNARGGKKWAANNPAIRMASVRNRQAAKINRTPKWADKEKMKAVYIEAQRLTAETGINHEVDHIYPLQGDTVSGLHVENNLQVITMTENRKKGKK